MKQRKSYLLRMDPKLYEALEAWAQQEMRSLNGQIEYLLTEAVRKRGKDPANQTKTGNATKEDVYRK